MEPGDPVVEQRGGCLVLVLAAGLAGFLVVAAFVVTGGLLLFFLVTVALLAAFIGLNYLLWGWMMPSPVSPKPPDLPPADAEEPPPSSDAITELAPDDPRRARHD
jgi:hypothetical protein